MIKSVFAVLISVILVTGCTIGFLGGHRGGTVVIVPALPVIVEIDADRYYYQDGYYYRYQGDIWLYATARLGPWYELPRSHYPREVRFRRHDEREHDRDHDNDKYHR